MWLGPSWAQRDPGWFRAATRQERLCFAAECGLGRLGHTGTPDGLEQPHEKNGPVLLQNVAPTPLGTHEHSRVHFLIRAPVVGEDVVGVVSVLGVGCDRCRCGLCFPCLLFDHFTIVLQ